MPFPAAEEWIARLQAFDFGQELRTIVSDNLDKLPVYLKEQLAAGQDGDGNATTIFGRSGYSPRTVAIKEANGVGLGAVTDRVTNYMSGDFFNSMVEKMEGDVFETDSDVAYFGDITLRSTPNQLFINEQNRLDFANTVTLPAIKEALLAKTGLEITS